MNAGARECKRPRTAYFLHVWFARRPLTVSRAAVLASEALPQTDEMYGHMDAMDAMDNEEDRHGGLSHDRNYPRVANLTHRQQVPRLK
ncbi:MAG: DUF1156 domain-containing protein [Capsulimonadaceae bacterium]